jgi:hypothetical protein
MFSLFKCFFLNGCIFFCSLGAHVRQATYVLEEVSRAVSLACGPHPGPVHLNLMFRENLAPDAGARRGDWRSAADQKWGSSDSSSSSGSSWGSSGSSWGSSSSSDWGSSVAAAETSGGGPKWDRASGRAESSRANRADGAWDRAAVRTGRFRTWLASGAPLVQAPAGAAAGSSSSNGGHHALADLASGMRGAKRGLVVAGPLASAADRAAVLASLSSPPRFVVPVCFVEGFISSLLLLVIQTYAVACSAPRSFGCCHIALLVCVFKFE